MDSKFRGRSGSINANGFQMRSQPFPNEPISNVTNQNFVAGPILENNFVEHNFRGFSFLPPNPTPGKVAAGSSVNHEEDSIEDSDLSNEILRYINRMLMEEDMEEKTCMLPNSLALQAAEKSFYEVLGKKYPPSPEQTPTDVQENRESLDGLHDRTWMENLSEYQSRNFPNSIIYQSSFSSMSSTDGLADSRNGTTQVPDWNGKIQSRVEEASNFLSKGNNLFVNLDDNEVEQPELDVGATDLVLKEKKKEEARNSLGGLKERKSFHRENLAVGEERSRKQTAIYPDPSVRSELFDMVLLGSSLQDQITFSDLHNALQNGTGKVMLKDGQLKVSSDGNGRGKKQNERKEVVDLRQLLISCAQAVAANDHKNVNELLKQIRQHASLFGDGNQRVAHCFADALEARSSGIGTQIYKGIVSKRTSTADILRCYCLYLVACPYRKVFHFIANKTTRMVADNSMRLHVIDFGIGYGFQWPTFIQRLSQRQGGPPRLRITGVDFPQPGFRPAEQVEETGSRLEAYAKEFKVPFEFNAIARRWDAIKVEELKIDREELIVVNCLFRGRLLLDESVEADSPRTVVLNLIRQINPDIFIHGILNGAHGSPFFVTRFRQALFHFSAVFDMFETILTRDDPERILLEKEFFYRQIFNIIACEGWERVERPETYRAVASPQPEGWICTAPV